MKVLVCGGRTYNDYDKVRRVLSNHVDEITLIIEGGAPGADRLGRKFAKEFGLPVKTYPADWERYGKSAGHIRNQQMLDEGEPELVVAFPGGPGTANMIARAKKAGVKVVIISG